MRTVVPRRRTLAASAIAIGFAITSASAAFANIPPSVGHPTKSALCKKSNYKIGFDTYSETDPFAVGVNDAIHALAKKLGCVTIVQTVNDQDGTKAVTNQKTLINQGIQGLINWNTVASAQPAIAKMTKDAHIPVIESSGAFESNAPNVGLDHYAAGYLGGKFLAQTALKRYPSEKEPYLIVTTYPTGGKDQVEDGQGVVDAFKKYYPHIPSSHVITVPTDAQSPTAYNGTLSAFSKVPSDALVLMTGTNTATIEGQYRAAIARNRAKFLVAEETGSKQGLQDVCKFKQYIGSIDFNPPGWANYMLPAIMVMINGVKLPAVVPIKPIIRTKASIC